MEDSIPEAEAPGTIAGALMSLLGMASKSIDGLSRSDISAIMVLKDKHAEGSIVRAETAALREALHDSRAAHRDYGRQLRQERLRGAQHVSDLKAEGAKQAGLVGRETRVRREELRKRREASRRAWQEHGRDLAVQQSALQGRMRRDEEERAEVVVHPRGDEP